MTHELGHTYRFFHDHLVIAELDDGVGEDADDFLGVFRDPVGRVLEVVLAQLPFCHLRLDLYITFHDDLALANRGPFHPGGAWEGMSLHVQ